MSRRRTRRPARKAVDPITASSGLSRTRSEDGQDAEAHADEDKKFHDLVQVRNQADSMIHATRKSMGDRRRQAGSGEKEAIDKAIAELEEAMKGSDKDAIEAKTKASPRPPVRWPSACTRSSRVRRRMPVPRRATPVPSGGRVGQGR